MNVRYRVTLTADERLQLETMIQRGKVVVRKIKRAQILLAAEIRRATTQPAGLQIVQRKRPGQRRKPGDLQREGGQRGTGERPMEAMAGGSSTAPSRRRPLLQGVRDELGAWFLGLAFLTGVAPMVIALSPRELLRGQRLIARRPVEVLRPA
jgi:hypothetical protein